MRRLFVVAAVLCVVIVLAAALQGAATFTAPRWDTSWRIAPSDLPERPAFDNADQSASPAPTPVHGAAHVNPLLVIVVLALIAVVVLAYILFRLRQRTPRRFTTSLTGAPQGDGGEVASTPAAEADVPPAVIRRGIAHALVQIREERPPGDAIIAAWLGLEESAEDSGLHRRPAETAAEFTAAAIARLGAEHEVRELLALYQGVRFGGHRATAADVVRATAYLETLRERWS
ncbi:protein of unknown function [Paramicrobacterium humi]|uniref:Protein-glutamine gamma-glutamyltransferase-like C-terminal domain-containing protein n=1 Tax=Paramicrobacterium humi TaxID=640635 RepID=A0A1H4QXZ3_9MICO|nr:DUF4129 domain-containing protein [Microbacterium humi]SEC24485.1 protein of unknown function [Microbacterium humi]